MWYSPNRRAARFGRHVRTGVWIVVSSLLFLACTADDSQDEADGGEPGVTADESPVDGEDADGQRTVTVALASFGCEQMDPSNCSTTDLLYNGAAYDWLIGANPEGELDSAFGVLESWESNEDASAWTFNLKEDLTWHDGEPVTAQDVKFTLEHFGREDAVCTSCGGVRESIDDIAILDDHTVEITLQAPDVNFPNLFGPLEGDVQLFPQHYIEEVGIDAFKQDPIGSGPWEFSSRSIGESITYEANDEYWNSERRPGFDRLRILLVPEATTRTTMLERGEVDLAVLNPENVTTVQDAGLDVMGPQSVLSSHVMMPGDKDDPAHVTNDLAFREALAKAVDWDEIVDAFYPPEVGSRVANSPMFGPVTLGYDPELEPYQYEPDRARELLEESSYEGGPVRFWNFTFAANPEQLEVNEVIASFWRDELGLDVEIIPIEWATYRERLVPTPQDFESAANFGVNTPSTRPSVLGNIRVFMISHEAGGALSLYHDPDKIDPIYEELLGVVDRDERDRILTELNRELHEEYWAFPIVHRHLPYGVGEAIADWSPVNGTPAELAYETLQPSS